MSFRHFLILASAACLLASTAAMAQTNLHDASGTFDGLLASVRNSANAWSGKLRGEAQFMFWSLVTIQIVWTFGLLAIRQAPFMEFAAELVKLMLTRGFFFGLLLYSVEIGEAIINSFRQLGANAAGVGAEIHPGDMFALAVELTKTIGDVDVRYNPLASVVIGLSQIVVLLCFTFIAAFMAVTLIEAYIVINAAVLFMGFGGSQWTQEYAVTMFRYALAVGAKLFVLTLIVGLIMELARQWQIAYNAQADEASMWTVLGLALICAYACKTLGELIQALITGVSPGGGSIVGGMAAAGMAAGVGAMAALQASASGGLLGGAGKGISDLFRSIGGGGFGGTGMGIGSHNTGGGGTPPPRTGGGGNSGPATGPAPKTGESPSGGPPRSGGSGGSASPAPKASTVTTMAHAAMQMGIKTVGTAASIAMPGAEGLESQSLGPPPAPPDFSDTEMLDTPENVIRPADVQNNEVAPQQGVNTMSSVQEALNKGKSS